MDKDNTNKTAQDPAKGGAPAPRNNNHNHNKQRNRNRGGNNNNRRDKEPLYVAPYNAQLLATPLSQLSLSEATLAALTKARLTTVGEVAVKRAQEMYKVQNFGKRNLTELANALHGIGVDFRPQDGAAPTAQPPAAGKNNGDRKNGKNQGQQPVAPAAKAPAKDNNTATPNRNADKEGAKRKKQRKGGVADGMTLEQVFPRPKFVPSAPTPMLADDYIKFQRGGKWGFKDKRGKELIPPIYDEVFNFKEDMACVERKQLFGYIDRNNELVIPYRYDCAGSFSGGYACVGDADKCGYINKQGEVVVPFVYDAGMPVADGKARVKKDGRWGVLSLDTNEINWN